MKNPYKKISGKTVYKNKFIILNVDEILIEGKRGQYVTTIEHQSDKFIFLIVKDNKNNFYLVKQWRYPINKETIEFVAGGVELKETPLQAAKRELHEELGMKAEKWTSLGNIISAPGKSKTKIYIYLAEKAKIIDENYKTNAEYTERLKINKKGLSNLIKKNKIDGAGSSAAYLKYLIHKNKIK